MANTGFEEFDAAMGQIVKNNVLSSVPLNKSRFPEDYPQEDYPQEAQQGFTGKAEFVPLGEKLAEAMVEAAQQALSEAQNNLEAAKMFAKKIHEDISKKNNEHQDLLHRLKNFSKSMLEAHERFHGPAGLKINR